MSAGTGSLLVRLRRLSDNHARVVRVTTRRAWPERDIWTPREKPMLTLDD